jgi:hypothetical protein
MPSEVRTHSKDIFVFVPCEERVSQTCVKHKDQLLDGCEKREMMSLKILKGCWKVLLHRVAFLHVFLLHFNELKKFFFLNISSGKGLGLILV